MSVNEQIAQEGERIKSLSSLAFNLEIAEVLGWKDIRQHKRFGYRGINPTTGQVTSVPSYSKDLTTLQTMAEEMGSLYPRVTPVCVYDRVQNGWFVNLIEKNDKGETISDIQGGDTSLNRAFGGALLLEHFVQTTSKVKENV